MALYYLEHGHFGAADIGKIGGRISYICRENAATEILAARVPASRMDLFVHTSAAAAKIEADREFRNSKNGRLAESFILALPREGTPEQRAELVQAFAEHVTKGACGYVAAIHAEGKDAANPHAHLLAFDEPIRQPGRRGRPGNVIGASRNPWLDEVREDWARIHNAKMAEWGYGQDSMIDHRTLEAQGIDREPTQHDGPARRAMMAKGITLPPRPPRRPRKGRKGVEGTSPPPQAPERPLTAWARAQIADLRARGANMPTEAECAAARKAGDPDLWRRTAEGGAGDGGRKDRQLEREVARAIRRTRSKQHGDD